MQRRSVPRTDPRYNQIRARNNDSVKKSREKSRRERDETIDAINQLEEENEQLLKNIETMKHEYEQLQELFKKHTGISLDELMTSQTTSTTSISSSSIEPKPIEEKEQHQQQQQQSQSTEIPSQPVLTINTNEETTSSTTDIQIDPHSLDGAIVLINGVQYKIVSMNKN